MYSKLSFCSVSFQIGYNREGVLFGRGSMYCQGSLSIAPTISYINHFSLIRSHEPLPVAYAKGKRRAQELNSTIRSWGRAVMLHCTMLIQGPKSRPNRGQIQYKTYLSIYRLVCSRLLIAARRRKPSTFRSFVKDILSTEHVKLEMD